MYELPITWQEYAEEARVEGKDLMKNCRIMPGNWFFTRLNWVWSIKLNCLNLRSWKTHQTPAREQCSNLLSDIKLEGICWSQNFAPSSAVWAFSPQGHGIERFRCEGRQTCARYFSCCCQTFSWQSKTRKCKKILIRLFPLIKNFFLLFSVWFLRIR